MNRALELTLKHYMGEAGFHYSHTTHGYDEHYYGVLYDVIFDTKDRYIESYTIDRDKGSFYPDNRVSRIDLTLETPENFESIIKELFP